MIILIGKDVWSKWQIIEIIVLLSGIALTGSRTSFFVLMAVLTGYMVLHKASGIRRILLLLTAGMVVLTGLYVILTGNAANVGRYLTSFTNTSTFLGRLLYDKDALPIILRHPLGLGYMGYYYLQGSFQTGVYSVLHIHNELLQILLDVGWIPAAAGILIGVNCWLGVVSGFYRWGNYETAAALYPGCTDAWLKMLPQAEDEEEMGRVADRILALNQSVSLAYSAKARLAYAKGDFERMIEHKQKAIALAKYETEEYLDYFDMLYVGVQLYEQAGDEESARFCRQKLLEIPDMMEEILDGTDELAYRIQDKPELELPEKYREMLHSMEL